VAGERFLALEMLEHLFQGASVRVETKATVALPRLPDHPLLSRSSGVTHGG
jgi:hypothetical protein